LTFHEKKLKKKERNAKTIIPFHTLGSIHVNSMTFTAPALFHRIPIATPPHQSPILFLVCCIISYLASELTELHQKDMMKGFPY
jgi:hypothetical protein